MTKNTVDIFCLTYYRLNYLKSFIEFLYLSTKYPFRLFVINNAKEDVETINFLNKMVENGLVYKYLNTEENVRMAKAFTIGFNTFKEELNKYVLTSPNDIIPPLFKPDWLELFVTKMESDKEIGCINFKGVRGSYESFNRRTRPLIYDRIKEEGGWRLDLLSKLQKILYE